MTASTPGGYFDAMYQAADDPWHLSERWYERRKYDLTLAALPRPRFRRAFEPACSVGELTRRLAGRCDDLLSCDRVPAAVATALRHTADLPQVTVTRMEVPEEWPQGSFDLIVLSELLYYFDEPTMDRLVERSVSALEAGGVLATVHWDHPVPEHLRTGSDIARRLADVPGMTLLADHRETDFVLQTYGRDHPDGRRQQSPAAREGLV